MAPSSIGTTTIAENSNYSVVPNVLAQANQIVAAKASGYRAIANSPVSV